ncbi:unnamed protein product [Pleuronectes platessa]|uniref:Uncharacterized protein n=1 Tax=Pleuronectes platessa TaxID=8262 RepID=A0A9N7TT03_PLEPL|nr:unnamed protein product [Pleuronectes platessa]
MRACACLPSAAIAHRTSSESIPAVRRQFAATLPPPAPRQHHLRLPSPSPPPPPPPMPVLRGGHTPGSAAARPLLKAGAISGAQVAEEGCEWVRGGGRWGEELRNAPYRSAALGPSITSITSSSSVWRRAAHTPPATALTSSRSSSGGRVQVHVTCRQLTLAAIPRYGHKMAAHTRKATEEGPSRCKH